MTTTTIRCTHCGQTYDLTPDQVPQYAGRTITCTTCKQPFTVAMHGATSAPPPLPAGYPPPYPQSSAYAPQHQQPTQGNPLAVTSLVLGILGFVIPVIPSLIAIVLGILGISKTKDPRVGGKGFAVAGIVTGALGFVILPCLISILLPSLNRARETANRVKCASNMKQIGQALLLYGNNNRGQYPPDLATLLNNSPLMIDTTVCPSSNDTPAAGPAQLNAGGHLSYVYVSGQSTSSSFEAILLYEPLTNHDNDGINILFGDGHVEFLRRTDAEPLITAVEAGQNPPRTGAEVR
ncbi:MAG: DUF4190 domain-containing protein [Tepidisphaeraceae bacterium]